MQHSMLIGIRLRECRNYTGLSLEKLAEKTALSPAHISRIENGRKNLSLEAFIAIVTALHASADYILFGKQDISIPCPHPYQNLLEELSPNEKSAILKALEILKTMLTE